MIKKLLAISFLLLPVVAGFPQIIKRRIPDKLVVLTFDDATASQYSNVAPMLKQHGFGATFFICEFPPNSSDSLKYMNWRQIRQLSLEGFEMANHTHTHAKLSKLDAKGMNDQLAYIENKFDSAGIPAPKTFAYPGYDLSPSVLEFLQKKGYLFARAGGSRPYDPMKDNPLLVPSWAMNANNKDAIMEAFSQARDGKIVVLTIHGVPDTEHPWVNTPPELFREYVEYLDANHFKVIGLADLVKYIDAVKAGKDIKPDFSARLKN